VVWNSNRTPQSTETPGEELIFRSVQTLVRKPARTEAPCERECGSSWLVKRCSGVTSDPLRALGMQRGAFILSVVTLIRKGLKFCYLGNSSSPQGGRETLRNLLHRLCEPANRPRSGRQIKAWMLAIPVPLAARVAISIRSSRNVFRR
jgi:hypothetical protein